MSSPIMALQGNALRKPLQRLHDNLPLSARPPVPTPPISYDQENEIAVNYGVAMGIYDEDEIRAVTNFSLVGTAPSHNDEDDAEGIEALARDLEQGGLYGRGHGDDGSENGEDFDLNLELEHEDDDDLDDDEGLGDHRFGEIVDEDIQDEDDDDEDLQDDEQFEYDAQPDAQDEVPVRVFDPVALGLKEINNLAHFSVSSHKPGNGVAELLIDDLDTFWQ